MLVSINYNSNTELHVYACNASVGHPSVPFFSKSWRRCCQKLLNGAIPVPGPIRMHGVDGSFGSWNPAALISIKCENRFVRKSIRWHKSIPIKPPSNYLSLLALTSSLWHSYTTVNWAAWRGESGSPFFNISPASSLCCHHSCFAETPANTCSKSPGTIAPVVCLSTR